MGLSIIDNTDNKEYKEIKEKNFKDMKDINTFYLRGAFNYQKLNFIDKIMMTIFKFILKKQKEEEMDDNTKGMLDAYDNPVDFVNKESIKPIIARGYSLFIKKLLKKLLFDGFFYIWYIY